MSGAMRRRSGSAAPLPPLASRIHRQPVQSLILTRVMGGCEMVDLAVGVTPESRLVVDLSVIGLDARQLLSRLDQLRVEPSISGCSLQEEHVILQEDRPVQVSGDQLVTAVPILEIKDSPKPVATEMQLGASDESGANCGAAVDSTYDYASLIEGMINNVFESANEMKVGCKEAVSTESGLDFFNYDGDRMIELPAVGASAPVLINLQNYYETFEPQSVKPVEHFDPVASFESSPSPDSTLEPESEANKYYDLDRFKVEGSSRAEDLQSLEGFESFLKLGSSAHVSLALPPVQRRQPTGRKRKRAQVLPADREKKIGCSLCDKKFRTQGHLKTHFAVHSGRDGARNVDCTLCEKSFCHRGALTLHMRAHSVRLARDNAYSRGETFL